MRLFYKSVLLGAALSWLLAVAGPAVAANDDGLLRLHLMWTNDMHGHIAPEAATFMFDVVPPSPSSSTVEAKVTLSPVRTVSAPRVAASL